MRHLRGALNPAEMPLPEEVAPHGKENHDDHAASDADHRGETPQLPMPGDEGTERGPTERVEARENVSIRYPYLRVSQPHRNWPPRDSSVLTARNRWNVFGSNPRSASTASLNRPSPDDTRLKAAADPAKSQNAPVPSACGRV